MNTVGQRPKIVAALEEADEAAVRRFIGNGGGDGCETGEPVTGHCHSSQRIEPMGVEARGDQDEIGVEGGGCRAEDCFEGDLEIQVALSSWEGDIHCETHACAPALLGEGTCPRIEGELVRTEEKHVLSIVKNVLGSVAMVHVPIDDQDSFAIGVFQGMTGRDGNVIEEAESHGSIRFCMVAGGTHQGKGVASGATHDCIHGIHARPGREKCCVHRLCRCDRVSIDDGATTSDCFDRFTMTGTVDLAQGGHRGGVRCPADGPIDWVRVEAVQDSAESIRPFWVAGARIVPDHPFICEKKRWGHLSRTIRCVRDPAAVATRTR